MDELNIIKRFITASEWEQQEQYLEMRNALHRLDFTIAQGLIPYALDLHDRQVEPSDAEPGMTLLQWLMQIRPEVCADLPTQLLKRRIFGQGFLYYGADAATRAALISEVEVALARLVQQCADLVAHTLRWSNQSLKPWSDQSLKKSIRMRLGQMAETRDNWQFLDLAFRALAWIGDEPVQQWFQQMRTQMTSWETLFALSIDDYVSQGGWELTPEGERRDLYFSHAHQLIPATMHSDDYPDAVAVALPFEEHCHWCENPLTALFDLDLSHPALSYLSMNGHRLRLIMCEGCFLTNRLFMEIDFEGHARWSSFNTPTPAEPEKWEMLFTPPDHRLVLGPTCASPFEVVTRGDQWDVSQLGGMPSWVQEAEFVVCPACHQHMTFIGQVFPGAITNKAVDGVFYALLCLNCRISTVAYQCT